MSARVFFFGGGGGGEFFTSFLQCMFLHFSPGSLCSSTRKSPQNVEKFARFTGGEQGVASCHVSDCHGFLVANVADCGSQLWSRWLQDCLVCTSVKTTDSKKVSKAFSQIRACTVVLAASNGCAIVLHCITCWQNLFTLVLTPPVPQSGCASTDTQPEEGGNRIASAC